MRPFFDCLRSSSQCRAIQDVVGEPVRGVALGMLEKIAIYLKRDGRIGMPEPMLNFGNRCPGCDHRGGAAVAKRVKGHASETGSHQSGIEGDSQEPISAYRLAYGIRENEILLGNGALQLPAL